MSAFLLDWFTLAGNENNHTISDEFDFGQDKVYSFGFKCNFPKMSTWRLLAIVALLCLILKLKSE